MGDRFSVDGRIVSVGGTLVGLALLGVGVAVAGSGGFELLLASGAADRTAPNVVAIALAGTVAGVVGLAVLSRTVDDDDAPDDEQGTDPAESAGMYQSDM
jgi:hypothetical protein